MSADVDFKRSFLICQLFISNRIYECSKVLKCMSSIPTNRKIQIQKCQGDGTRAIPGEIANVPQHADVIDLLDSLCRMHSVPNGKMHNCKVHSKVEDVHRLANVVFNLHKLSSTTHRYLSPSGKVLRQKENVECRKKNMSTLLFTTELPIHHLNTKNKADIYIYLADGRSNTFTSNGWPREPGIWWPWLLAEAGFYYRGHDLEVHCYSCKLKTSLRDWCHKVNEMPSEAHARLNRNCEHIVSNGFFPNPNVPEDFQKGDKQASNSETCMTLTNVGIPAISKNNSLKTTDTPNAVNGYSCEQRNLTNIAATDNAFNAVNGYSREQRNLTEIDNTANAISGFSHEQRNLTDIAATANASNAVTPEMSDRHQSSIMSPGSTPKDKNNSIGSKNGYRIETLNNLAKSNTSNQILQKETTDSNNSVLPQINASSRKEPIFDGNVGNGNWSLSQDSILKDNNMSIDVRDRKHMINNFNYSIDIAQVDASNGMNSQLTQDGQQSYQPEFRYPQYETLTARKSSYDKWQFGHKQSSDVLSNAGYFYTGEQDIVRCFCCDLGLAEWDAKDNAWREHARHNPKCWFLKSQKGDSYIKEIQLDWKKIYNPKHTAFDDKQSRVATFDGWRLDIEQTPDILADAGFFYTGEEDVVRCHYCDGGLRHWEPGDVPWEEHAKWFSFCKYVIKMKGRDFIDNIKAAREQRERIQNMDTSLSGENGHNSVLKTLRDLQINDDDLAYAVEKYVKRKGNNNFKVEDILDLVHEKQNTPASNPFAASNFIHDEPPVEKDPKKIKEINRQLKEKMRCIRCKNKEICMLFVNCGHRVTCEECSERMDFCPYCDARIKKRLKTFLS